MKYSILLLWVSIASIAQKNPETIISVPVSDPAHHAISPRWTTNHLGQPVLSWSEENDSSEVIAFCFITSLDGGKTFGVKKQVRIVPNISAHAEGMPKLAYKSDGTLVAVYEINRPVPGVRFSGDILYTMSSDDGLTWSTPVYAHRDTSAGKSRSFSDLIRLPDGEIGLAWLGERGKGSGRPVKYAHTTKGNGFSDEVIAKDGACECCRTNLFVDADQRLHIFFRDILPGGIRDMGHVVSSDGGKTFGNYKVVYADQWKVNACPHTGPTTAMLGNTLYTAWYTGEESNIGVKVTDNAGKILTHIKTASARHPQMVHHQNKLVLVWDEPVTTKNNDMALQIQMSLGDKNGFTKGTGISSVADMANYPCLLSNGSHLLVAYEVGLDKKQIHVKVMEMGDLE